MNSSTAAALERYRAAVEAYAAATAELQAAERAVRDSVGLHALPEPTTQGTPHHHRERLGDREANPYYRFRVDYGFSQRDAARLVGVSQYTWGRWERNLIQPRPGKRADFPPELQTYLQGGRAWTTTEANSKGSARATGSRRKSRS